MGVEIGMHTYFWYAIPIGVENPDYVRSFVRSFVGEFLSYLK